ncbi:hypothetical protein LB505_004814 [Fusarium chuoi]|nr:hypothetical protein LB505_004814 [Fusarium chuoi]
MDVHNQPRLPPPKPVGLNNILNNDNAPVSIVNGPPHMRDSGFYSNADASTQVALAINPRRTTRHHLRLPPT